MNFIEFQQHWQFPGVFSLHQVRAWKNGFDQNNLTRWIAKGYLSRLKNGWFALASALSRPEIDRFIAGKIYSPSYISLETALCAYDIIPEAVTDITSISSKKTCVFQNRAGAFFYYSVKPELMFGYKPVPTPDGLYYMLALPEKAILDFLYLHHEYKTESDMEQLRFDEYFMSDELDTDRLYSFLEKFQTKALDQRISTLIKTYSL